LDGNHVKKAIALLEETIAAYVQTLDGDEHHPFIDYFYQVLAGVYYNNNMIPKAQDLYKKLVKSKESMYGEDAKEVIQPLFKYHRIIVDGNSISNALTTGL